MRWIAKAAPLALAGLIGCGGPGVKLVPVSGTITRNGKPLAEAMVSFVPAPGAKPDTPGGAATGPEGRYTLKWQDYTGVAPGRYHVTVTPPVELPPGAKVNEAFKNDPYMAEYTTVGGRKANAAPKASERKGEFDVEVSATGGTFDYDFKSP